MTEAAAGVTAERIEKIRIKAHWNNDLDLTFLLAALAQRDEEVARLKALRDAEVERCRWETNRADAAEDRLAQANEALADARRVALEEAAKVCDDKRADAKTYDAAHAYSLAAVDIRALSTQAKEGE